MVKTKSVVLSAKKVTSVAKLAWLELTDQETKQYLAQFNEILEYVKKLDQVNTAQTKPSPQVTGLHNVTRPDEQKKNCLPLVEVMKNIPTRQGNFVEVEEVLKK